MKSLQVKLPKWEEVMGAVIFREPSDSTMSDSENSVAVKEFLHTVHCTPKLRLVEDINKNKLLIMETLETIDEENMDDLQKDFGQQHEPEYRQLEDFWDEDETQDQHRASQLYTFYEGQNKSEVNLAQPVAVRTVGEELLLEEILDEFVIQSNYSDQIPMPPHYEPTDSNLSQKSQSVLRDSSSSDLNLSNLDFSDADNILWMMIWMTALWRIVQRKFETL